MGLSLLLEVVSQALVGPGLLPGCKRAAGPDAVLLQPVHVHRCRQAGPVPGSAGAALVRMLAVGRLCARRREAGRVRAAAELGDGRRERKELRGGA